MLPGNLLTGRLVDMADAAVYALTVVGHNGADLYRTHFAQPSDSVQGRHATAILASNGRANARGVCTFRVKLAQAKEGEPTSSVAFPRPATSIPARLRPSFRLLRQAARLQGKLAKLVRKRAGSQLHQRRNEAQCQFLIRSQLQSRRRRSGDLQLLNW